MLYAAFIIVFLSSIYCDNIQFTEPPGTLLYVSVIEYGSLFADSFWSRNTIFCMQQCLKLCTSTEVVFDSSTKSCSCLSLPAPPIVNNPGLGAVLIYHNKLNGKLCFEDMHFEIFHLL